MKKVLVVQFQVGPDDTLERFHGVEDTLIQAFDQNRYAVVDGHDYGQGRFNIYIYPRGAWDPVIDRVIAFLKLKDWLRRAVIAKGLESGKWQVIWPDGYVNPFHL